MKNLENTNNHPNHTNRTMPEYTPRQELIRELADKINDALQTDFEHGAKSINEAAAEEFHRKYPELSAVLDYIVFLYYDELPLD